MQAKAMLLWAKTGSRGRWHAVPYHLVDVAATAEALWDCLPSASRKVVIDLIGDEALCRRLIAFLAGAHDVGKANPYFQAKEANQKQRLISEGFQLPSDEPHRHGQATGACLKPWLMKHLGWSNFASDTTALAIGGHHGTFFQHTNMTSLKVDTSPWREIGEEMLDDLAQLLELPAIPEPVKLNPFLGWLSGFVSVADWLGSHYAMTVWETGATPLSEYLKQARGRAKTLLQDLNWQIPAKTSTLSPDQFLPKGSDVNALQAMAQSIASQFWLAIIEAPTGEGKTEAAFALAEPGRSAGHGIYFALPTMATANGLYERVEAYLQKGTPNEDVKARLLHSQSWLFSKKGKTTLDPLEGSVEQEAEEEGETVTNPGEEGVQQEAQAQDWFAGSKRAMLAPYGVGTIDQALIAALRAKHGFVRLFALAGKTVVIDEVHAYDIYMADLMDVLLGWLRVLGCRVILLSATLPKARREALLKAWGAEGARPEAAYPCITWVDEEGKIGAKEFSVEPRKALTFNLIPAEKEKEPWQEGAARILDRVKASGGLGALVLNTVRDAQRAYDWLKEEDLGGIELKLFHARFTAQDRKEIENAVLKQFGKNGLRVKPAILVATQVVEQSLDLDFDHMVSALAPIDLLIQRAGRLHRHKRFADGRLRDDQGPDERPNPVLDVLAPPVNDEVPKPQDQVYFHDVLLRSLKSIEERPQALAPEDVSYQIERVYGERERVEDISAWESRLDELEKKTTNKIERDKRQAEKATIGVASDEDCLIVETYLDLDENDERQNSQLSARTRLEERPSITVAFLRKEGKRIVTVHGKNPRDLLDATLACVRISPPFPLWEALLDVDPFPGWRKKGSLAYVKPVTLTEGVASVGNYLLDYDEVRGLDWRKRDAQL